ncbi:ParB N-terminal domain-containing protein [Rivularia sp. UHCC 0363]|uniref:ParB N-terminal domain-containing protein n=1 Tax=Rivularia sp. UHCC 0363 TaxID=3110244 RepID=UPI002B21F8F4|nr:ParB N-terminal domain-containing protein [Rivularia sp. UHCC 0363]MEA5595654.1 ParB N-terminal domain-containing protein [Rivularia sp. UHCC 0363]
MSGISQVSIEKIKFGNNRRPINGQKVEQLKESIQLNGLLNPIAVDQNFNLIAGLHRLTACKLLGYKEIKCNIVTYDSEENARLAEIDENLIRNELEPLERGKLVLEREKILIKLGMRAKAGDNQYTLKTVENGSEIISPPAKTTQQLAKQAGYSERSWQHDKQIARDIAPKIQKIIQKTAIADKKTTLLNIARAGRKERILAQKALQAYDLAVSRGDYEEAEQQAKLATKLRAGQEELQLQAFHSAMAELQAKSDKKEQQVERPKMIDSLFNQDSLSKIGDKWTLGNRHLVYYGDTAGNDFIKLLPSNAALAIATASDAWNHDYLVDEAKIVAVLRSEDNLFQFCSTTRMTFQYELLLGKIYVGIFSRQPVSKPQIPINLDNVEGIIQYLIDMFTTQNNYVIAPFMGHGEILTACEKMRRVCFIGDENLDFIRNGISRWGKWTEKQPEKIARSNYLYF